MDDISRDELLDWVLRLSNDDRRSVLAYLTGYAPQALHEALTWFDAYRGGQTPPQ